MNAMKTTNATISIRIANAINAITSWWHAENKTYTALLNSDNNVGSEGVLTNADVMKINAALLLAVLALGQLATWLS